MSVLSALRTSVGQRTCISVCLFGLAIATHASGSPCEPHWEAAFSGGDFQGQVRALAVDDTRDEPVLYAGGDFTYAGGVPANRVAQWNGTTWVPLGDGLNLSVFTLHLYDDGRGAGVSLYAGGSFVTSSGASLLRIARWNGRAWQSVGAGMNGRVYELTSFDNGDGVSRLFAAGSFSTSGGIAVSRIARWNGDSWEDVGGGLGGLSGVNAYAMDVFDDGSGPALYVGGTFTSAGGGRVSNIARWDGREWSDVGGGVNGKIAAMAVYDDGSGPALYVTGAFTKAGGAPAMRIAKWDGSHWSPLERGLSGPGEALGVFDDPLAGSTLYAGGTFQFAGSLAVNSIARWDGTSWAAAAEGIESPVNALAQFRGPDGRRRLLVGGDFGCAISDCYTTYAESHKNIAAWDGERWASLAMNSSVSSVASVTGFSKSGPELLVGTAARLAEFDQSVWTSIANPPSSEITVLAHRDCSDIGGEAELYAGGISSAIGGAPAQGIARWDGRSWAALGAGLNGQVLSIALDPDCAREHDLYAGGSFVASGSLTVNRIARWDGSQWHPLGEGVNGAVRALALGHDNGRSVLYAGGEFTQAGSVAANHVAQWDGDAWTPLGTGLNGVVRALIIFDDGFGTALYAGGRFTGLDGAPFATVARWNGESWSPILIDGHDMYALAAFDDGTGRGPALYAGGLFYDSESFGTAGVLRWDGASWSPLGTGLQPFVESHYAWVSGLVVHAPSDGVPQSLIAAGVFGSAGGFPSRNVAKWVGCAPIIADLNGDGVVNSLDLGILLVAWSIPAGEPGCGGVRPCAADLNHDGVVNTLDLGILLSSWTL